jgi:hypothetical protein
MTCTYLAQSVFIGYEMALHFRKVAEDLRKGRRSRAQSLPRHVGLSAAEAHPLE